jgi:hypothetical protein
MPPVFEIFAALKLDPSQYKAAMKTVATDSTTTGQTMEKSSDVTGKNVANAFAGAFTKINRVQKQFIKEIKSDFALIGKAMLYPTLAMGGVIAGVDKFKDASNFFKDALKNIGIDIFDKTPAGIIKTNMALDDLKGQLRDISKISDVNMKQNQIDRIAHSYHLNAGDVAARVSEAKTQLSNGNITGNLDSQEQVNPVTEKLKNLAANVSNIGARAFSSKGFSIALNNLVILTTGVATSIERIVSSNNFGVFIGKLSNWFLGPKGLITGIFEMISKDPNAAFTKLEIFTGLYFGITKGLTTVTIIFKAIQAAFVVWNAVMLGATFARAGSIAKTVSGVGTTKKIMQEMLAGASSSDLIKKYPIHREFTRMVSKMSPEVLNRMEAGTGSALRSGSSFLPGAGRGIIGKAGAYAGAAALAYLAFDAFSDAYKSAITGQSNKYNDMYKGLLEGVDAFTGGFASKFNNGFFDRITGLLDALHITDNSRTSAGALGSASQSKIDSGMIDPATGLAKVSQTDRINALNAADQQVQKDQLQAQWGILNQTSASNNREQYSTRSSNFGPAY